jgi:hypothetical protein
MTKPIATALLDASKRGIDVRVVVDKSNATARYTATFLASQGCRRGSITSTRSCTTGSRWWTVRQAAEKSHEENVLVLHDHAAAQRDGQEWDRLWRDAEEMKARY